MYGDSSRRQNVKLACGQIADIWKFVMYVCVCSQPFVNIYQAICDDWGPKLSGIGGTVGVLIYKRGL